jgi:hypothetical protein
MEEGVIQAQAMGAGALEMERHLRILLYMRRLTLPGGQPTAASR